MKKQVSIFGGAVLVAAVAWWFLGRPPTAVAVAPGAAVAPASTAASHPATTGPNILRYAAGAPQLEMILAQVLPTSAVPLTDALSARVVYDEDATARIGVGFAGRIVAVKAAPGDSVKPGQVLAEIDAPDVGSAYADLNKALADESRKRLALERARALGPGEAIAAKEFENAQADEAQARAETARAEQRIKNLNPYRLPVQGQRVALSSPVAGVVSERSANPGLEVGPGMAAPLFVVTDPKRLWILIDLPEKLVSRVKLGGAVVVESEAYPGERFNARIAQLGQSVDPNTRRIVVRARLDNPGRKLLPEMFVRAAVLQDSGSGVRVPNSALINRGLYAFVFEQTAPGEFLRRQVKLLSQGSDHSFVGEGLKGGEHIVVTGALLLDAEVTARSGAKP